MGEPQALFKFVHPNDEDPIDNRRQGTCRWTVTEAGMLHGFGGYFDSKLYKDVHISINPPTFSTGMFSWFNCFFPIRNPVYLNKGDVVEVVFWRCVNSKKVWYEWCLTSPRISAIHNVNGKHYSIGL
jgi:protein arginine N-methyltransferase 5